MKGYLRCYQVFGILALALAAALCLVTVMSLGSAPSTANAQLQQQVDERSDRAAVLKAMESARAATASERWAIHNALSGVAQQLAATLTQPNIRNLLLAQVRASQKREQMMEMEEFLVVGSKRPDIPATAKVTDLLASVRNTKNQIRGSRIRLGFAAQNIDLYFPVSQHRQNWQGNDDLIVAVPPLDESDTAPILAYSVKTGQRVTLDPKTPPATPVVVVGACEHEDHERRQERRESGIVPPPFQKRSQPGQLFDNEKPVLTRGKYPGNSTIYGYYTGMKDDHEPWISGSAEIYVVLVQYCGGNWYKRCNVYYVDDTYKNYYTKPDEVFSYTSNCSDHTYTAIWESDGGSRVSRSVGLITSSLGGSYSYSPNLYYYIEDGDDFIEDRYWFKSSIPYNTVSDIGMGYYGWVTMQKIQ